MEIEYTKEAERNMLFWIKSGDKQILKKIELLIEDIKKTPFSGIGKPEALKYKHQGKWSRRITEEHRLVYEVVEEEPTSSIQKVVPVKEDLKKGKKQFTVTLT